MDKRIRYYRNKKNIGVSKNHCKVFRLSKGEYFKWIAHDDLITSDFLEQCINVLEADKTIILCFPKSYEINEKGEITGSYEYVKNINSEKAHKRYYTSLGFSHKVLCLFGVIRSDALRLTRLIEDYIGADRNLLTELSLIGRFHQIPEYKFYFRMHPESYSYQYEKLKFNDHLAWWDPNKTRARKSIYTLNSVEFLRSIYIIPLKSSERIICTFIFFKWFFLEGWVRILEDFERIIFGRTIFFKKISWLIEMIRIQFTR